MNHSFFAGNQKRVSHDIKERERKDITLKPNILVQPDAPADLVSFVNGELLPEEVISLLVYRLVVRVFGTRINGAELAVPNLQRRRTSTERD